MQGDKETVGLRVFVKDGGCHGFQYGMSLESSMQEDDTIVEQGAVKIIMDSQSAPLLIGTEGIMWSTYGVRVCHAEPERQGHVWVRRFVQCIRRHSHR